MADPEGLEPPTPWFEAKCSIQLSYGSVDFLAARTSYLGDEAVGSRAQNGAAGGP